MRQMRDQQDRVSRMAQERDMLRMELQKQIDEKAKRKQNEKM